MNKKKIAIVGAIDVLLVAVMVAAVVVTNIFSPILTIYLGTIGGTEVSDESHSAYATVEELNAARRELGRDIIAEGAVLLRNERDTLPLAEQAKVSVFGQHAHTILGGGSGSGGSRGPEKDLKTVLEESGFSVNPTLWDFYLNNGGKDLGNGPALTGGNSQTDWSVNECRQSDYPDDVKASYKDYADAAIVVVSRTGGEGGDLAQDMSPHGGKADQHYLELTDEERELLTAVTETFDQVVVLLNTNNPMELGFLEEYDVGACLFIGGVGMSGLEAVGELLNGSINPSGHLCDTYVYDNFSAPSAQNFGDYTYTNCDYHYVVYAEGIYVGYRYYETRYADVVAGAENVGEFDYAATVQFPFGYGLSYTEFEWSDFSLSYDETSDQFTASVTVHNRGDQAGKDVVQLYFQAPYTVGGLEKSAVELVGFGKTDMLQPGDSAEVTITVDRRMLTSYDTKEAKTYVLDAGDYRFTAAGNAHEAVNNFLADQGHPVESAGTVEIYHQDVRDASTYAADHVTGTAITNLFDYARYDGMEVLSRSNWSVLDNNGLACDKLAISDEDLAQAKLTGKVASRNPNVDASVSAITTNSGGSLQLKDFVETPYDDPSWQKLLEQLKKSELEKLFATAGYATIACESIGKPQTSDMDGPGGVSSFVGGASEVESFSYPTEAMMACTWNVDLARRMGEMVGEDALVSGVSGWYAPAMDTHRSPFGGRNFEYYSEDGLLAGRLATSVVQGAHTKGLYAYIKHFALNEQDTNRGPQLHTWADEQAMREIYLTPFQLAVQEGGADALMTSLNCVGVTACVGDYNLITRLLRDEWGFQGMVITDYLGYDEQLMIQTLFAGGDAMLSTYGVFSNSDDQIKTELQRAAKNILYTVSRSNAMYSVGDTVSAGFPIYLIIVIAVECVLAAVLATVNILAFKPRKKKAD